VQAARLAAAGSKAALTAAPTQVGGQEGPAASLHQAGALEPPLLHWPAAAPAGDAVAPWVWVLLLLGVGVQPAPLALVGVRSQGQAAAAAPAGLPVAAAGVAAAAAGAVAAVVAELDAGCKVVPCGDLCRGQPTTLLVVVADHPSHLGDQHPSSPGLEGHRGTLGEASGPCAGVQAGLESH
jgi:hypothetical protein